MVDWKDPAEIQRDAGVFAKLIFSLFGLYVWELFMTCDFEWALITKRRQFRYPLVSCHLLHHPLSTHSLFDRVSTRALTVYCITLTTSQSFSSCAVTVCWWH